MGREAVKEAMHSVFAHLYGTEALHPLRAPCSAAAPTKSSL